jgi:hypothetical protein
MKAEIKQYSFKLPDGSIKTGKTITTYNDNGDEINIEEYYGVTAEEWLDQCGFGGERQPTLLYLRQAGAVSPKLDATEKFLNQVLGIFSSDPSPRSDWPSAPHGFEEVVGEAVGSLQTP